MGFKLDEHNRNNLDNCLLGCTWEHNWKSNRGKEKNKLHVRKNLLAETHDASLFDRHIYFVTYESDCMDMILILVLLFIYEEAIINITKT